MRRTKPLLCRAFMLLFGLALSSGCGVFGSGSGGDTDSSSGTQSPGDVGDTADSGDAADGVANDPGIDAQVVHEFPKYELDPGEEKIPCVQWTLNNEEPIYVNKVALANGGGFHHSNWFVVPEGYAEGKDGYFDCSSRGFHEISAATDGTVLFAQSTQAKSEVQKLPERSVIKIPPNHKVVADVHFLNTTTRKLETFARMTLGLVHPRNVEVVLTPFRLSYYDLQIPPNKESRFTADCDFAEKYEDHTGGKFDMELYYVLPHYHSLGNYFELEHFGGPRDGETIYNLQGFNAEANGRAFSPPIDMTGSEGFRFTCGYDNPHDKTIGWGLGGEEMCVMLGFAKSDVMIDATVGDGSQTKKKKNGTVYKEGPCTVVTFDKQDSQKPPTKEERKGEMYVPKDNTADDVEPIPDCEEIDRKAEPLRSPTLTNLHRDIFSVGCSFSACHSSEGPVAGLDLKTRKGLHNRLMNHDLGTPTKYDLVEPGKPSKSWLYRVTSRCKPESSAGPVSHMPRNSRTLMEPELVAMIREWIERGAKDN